MASNLRLLVESRVGLHRFCFLERRVMQSRASLLSDLGFRAGSKNLYLSLSGADQYPIKYDFGGDRHELQIGKGVQQAAINHGFVR
jgi:hypothetical protein